MPPRLPPHIAWPLFVVGLLSLSVLTVTITVIASRSDGGAQVVDDYYRKAVAWDEAVARQAASDALGWDAALTVPPTTGAARVATLSVRDPDGAPVAGLQGTITALRPHLVRPVAHVPLAAAAEQPGLYHAALPVADPGLWDFEVVATRDSLHFQATIRLEVE